MSATTHMRRWPDIDPAECGLSFWTDALKKKDNYIVRTSAQALGRIGPRAVSAVEPLGIATTANVEFGVPQNTVFCVDALVRIAPDDLRVVELLDLVAKTIDVSTGIKGLVAIGTPAAVEKLEHLYLNPADLLTGLNRHRVKKLLDKVEATFDGFRFRCPECNKPMGTGEKRFCANCQGS